MVANGLEQAALVVTYQQGVALQRLLGLRRPGFDVGAEELTNIYGSCFQFAKLAKNFERPANGQHGVAHREMIAGGSV
jgi:hypothetical protein